MFYNYMFVVGWICSKNYSVFHFDELFSQILQSSLVVMTFPGWKKCPVTYANVQYQRKVIPKTLRIIFITYCCSWSHVRLECYWLAVLSMWILLTEGVLVKFYFILLSCGCCWITVIYAFANVLFWYL